MADHNTDRPTHPEPLLNEDLDVLEYDEDENSDHTAKGIGAWGASLLIHAVILAHARNHYGRTSFNAGKGPHAQAEMTIPEPPPPVEKIRDLKEVEFEITAEVTEVNHAQLTDIELETGNRNGR